MWFESARPALAEGAAARYYAVMDGYKNRDAERLALDGETPILIVCIGVLSIVGVIGAHERDTGLSLTCHVLALLLCIGMWFERRRRLSKAGARDYQEWDARLRAEERAKEQPASVSRETER